MVGKEEFIASPEDPKLRNFSEKNNVFTLTSQYCIQEETKSELKSRNACYHSVQNILSSGLLSKNLKIETYRITILTVVLYGCETWSLKLRDERRLRVFENRVMSRIFGPKRDEVTGGVEKTIQV